MKEVVCGLVDENDPDERAVSSKDRRHALATHREKDVRLRTATSVGLSQTVAPRSYDETQTIVSMASESASAPIAASSFKNTSIRSATGAELRPRR